MFLSRPPRFARLLLAFLVVFAAAREAFALTAGDYETTAIEGWTVKVEKSLTGDPRREQALALLQSKLAAVRQAVPKAEPRGGSGCGLPSVGRLARSERARRGDGPVDRDHERG
jgi:hypothetical protein